MRHGGGTATAAAVAPAAPPRSPREAALYARLEATLRAGYAAGKSIDDVLADVSVALGQQEEQERAASHRSLLVGANHSPCGDQSLSPPLSPSPSPLPSPSSLVTSRATSALTNENAEAPNVHRVPRGRFNVDFWCVSSLQSYLAYENERGRHSRPYFLHQDAGTLSAEQETQLVEAGAHPREFITYGFTADLSGRPWLEKEARTLWADAVEAPVEVNRRFSEFQRLREVLAKVYQYRVGQSSRVHLILVPPLPPKKSFSPVSSRDTAFVLTRMRQLEVWLRYVTLHSIIGMSMPVRTFMLDSVHDGRDDLDEDDDMYTVDSHLGPLGSHSNASADAGAMSLLRSKHRRDRLSGAAEFAEDPIVAARARTQVDMVLRRFGSGPIALGAINAVLPGLQRGYHSGKMALRHLADKVEARSAEESALGLALLRLSKTEQHDAKFAPMRLDPLNYLGVALKRRRPDEAQANVAMLEAGHTLEETLRLFSKHIFPRMTHLVGFLYNSSVAARQEDEHQHGVTPSERLAAEWFCINNVRSTSVVAAAERFAEDQIMLAARRRARWERLRANLLRFDAQALYTALERDPLHGSDVNHPDEPSYAEFVRDRDRDSVYSEQSMLTFEQREEQIRQLQAAQARRPPPPVPSRKTKQRTKRVHFADDTAPAAPSRAEAEWVRSETDDGMPFWVNKHTGQTRHRPPATSPEERAAQEEVEKAVQAWSHVHHNLPDMLIYVREIAAPLPRFTDFTQAQKQAVPSSTQLQRKLVRQILRQTHPDKQPANQSVYNSFLAARLFQIFASLS